MGLNLQDTYHMNDRSQQRKVRRLACCRAPTMATLTRTHEQRLRHLLPQAPGRYLLCQIACSALQFVKVRALRSQWSCCSESRRSAFLTHLAPESTRRHPANPQVQLNISCVTWILRGWAQCGQRRRGHHNGHNQYRMMCRRRTARVRVQRAHLRGHRLYGLKHRVCDCHPHCPASYKAPSGGNGSLRKTGRCSSLTHGQL